MVDHDEQCEQGPNFYLCHCSKRQREARGLTAPPTEDLYFPPPRCPSCGDSVDHDGDSFCCYRCALAWGQNGQGPACFTDDYGDVADLRRRHDEARARARA